MKRISRLVQPEDLRDLLDRPPRASIAYVRGGRLVAAPASFRHDGGRYLVAPIGAPPGAAPRDGDTAMVLVDDGVYSLQLRGLRLRGVLRPAADAGWFELAPEKTIAWDYARMHERAQP